jgi:hypothetical protein
MKNVRIILSVLAFVAAIGAALATEMLTGDPGYTYQPPVGITPASCNLITTDCDNSGSFTCQVGGVTLKRDDSPSTQCGNTAKRLTAL